jgi:uncharacterized iron-regulated membrane protein
MSVRNDRRLHQWHLWLGLAFAPILMVIAATGILLGFYDELRYAEPPYRLNPAVEAGLPPAVLAQHIRADYPDYHLEVLYLPTAPERAARAKLVGKDRRLAFIHPGTGQTLAIRNADEQDGLDFLYALHRGKPLGLPGQIIASAGGISVPILWGIGLLLRWRRRIHRTRRRIWFTIRSLHRELGLILGGLLAVLAAAGSLLNFAGPLKQWLDPPPQLAGSEPTVTTKTLARHVSRATSAYPAAPLERIYFPADGSTPWQFRFRDGGWAYLDAGGRVLKIATPFSHWTHLLYPLHSGRLWGMYGPKFMALFGMVLLGLSGSGLYLYCRRRRANERSTQSGQFGARRGIFKW